MYEPRLGEYRFEERHPEDTPRIMVEQQLGGTLLLRRPCAQPLGGMTACVIARQAV
jgi:hypothetical protein